MAEGLGDPTGMHGLPRSGAAWEEGLCPWTGWCMCQSTQFALFVCACMCVYVCMHVCVCVCLAHEEYWQCQECGQSLLD